MARYSFRCIASDIWQDDWFRELSGQAKTIWFALVTRLADDEGRFIAAPGRILDAAFARSDPTTEADIQNHLQQMRRARKLVLYKAGGVTYGFLPSWFKHQVIRPAARQISSCPVPPRRPSRGWTLTILSWEECDAIRELFIAAGHGPRDGKGVQWRDAIYWLEDEVSAGRLVLDDRPTSFPRGTYVEPTSTPRSKSKLPTSTPRSDRTGQEQTGQEQTRKASPEEGGEEFSTGFPQSGEPESLNASSEPETAPNGNGNGAVMQACRNLGELFPEGPEAQEIRDYCAKHGEPGGEREQFTAQVLAEFGFEAQARAP